MPQQIASSKPYTPLLLTIYDTFVLGFSNTYIWLCPTKSTLLPLYRQNLGSRHLDVGVGTGYFPAHTLPSSPCKELVLLDLNPTALAVAQRRARRAAPDVRVSSVLRDVIADLDAQGEFDSISIFYLLHCLPQGKNAVFGKLAGHLSPDGVLFGATILGEGQMNWMAALLMRFYNWKGIFANWDDTEAGIRKGLEGAFEEVEVWVVGRVMLFVARRARGDFIV